MGALTEKYRKGAVKDFSVVSKAVFQIFENKPSAIKKGDWNFKLKDILPVQFNPSSLKVSCGNNRIKKIDGKLPAYTENGIPIVLTEDPSFTEDIEIALEYNIYDEYRIRTMDGTLTKLNLGNEISLESESATSLKKLTKYANLQGIYANFAWGEISYFGILSSIDVEYTVFSRWGEPLKAQPTIKIKKQSLKKTLLDDEEPSVMQYADTISKGKIKSYSVAQDVLNTAALAAIQASR